MTRLKHTVNHLRLKEKSAIQLLHQLKNKFYFDALKILSQNSKKYSLKIIRIIYTNLTLACCNLQNTYNIDKKDIIVEDAYITKGSIMKRMQARAKGKSFKIEKKTNHLTFKLKLYNYGSKS